MLSQPINLTIQSEISVWLDPEMDADCLVTVKKRKERMPPIRRYLRISKYSVLECRIYLETPSDSRWLLERSDNSSNKLDQIFTTIKPLVLPKLREENARGSSRKKKTNKNPVKDVLREGILFSSPSVRRKS